MLLPASAEIFLEENTQIKATLPDTVQNFSRIIGLPAALALVNKFGGTEIRMPSAGDGNPKGLYRQLVETIGDAAARELAKSYAGDEIYIPTCSKTRKALRDIELVRIYDDMIRDISCRQAIKNLAAEYHLSSRQVEKIVNRPSVV